MDIALFSPSSLFADSDGDGTGAEEGNIESNQNFVERKHQFPGMIIDCGSMILGGIYCNRVLECDGRAKHIATLLLIANCASYGLRMNNNMELLIREFSFHQLNANLLWPGTFAFIEWLVHHRSWMDGRKVIELGSGTGALAIFLHKSFQVDITTSDYDDAEIEENIAYNCQINGVTPVLPHVRHSWGDVFPISDPKWDLIIASDILLYVKQYPNLIKSLSFLLKSYKPKATNAISSSDDDACLFPRPAFLMSWRRRIGKEDEYIFFNGCEKAGLVVDHLGSRVYCITPKEITANHST